MQRKDKLDSSAATVIPNWACIISLLAVGLTSACGAAPENSETAGSAEPDSFATSDTSRAPDSIPAVDPPVDSVFLALEADGLRAFLASTGSARPLPFGTPTADAMSMLNAVMEAIPVEQGENVDCAAEYATWESGLTVWFANGRFAGWGVGPGSALTTVDGLGPGATRADLEAAYDPTIQLSSLGYEFVVGRIAGLLESGASNARVRHLWSGHVCLAR